MFISYELGRYNVRDKDGNYYDEYEIVDNEFGTALGVLNVNEIMPARYIEIALAVIQEYSKRELNVAANLAVAFIWYNKQYPRSSIQQMIDANKEHNPLFPPYEKDIQKYLVLL
jgi:hypothetical protein